MTQIERIRIKLGLPDAAEAQLLELYLEDATSDFLNYCGRDNVPENARGLIEDMAIAKYNQQGNEGLASQSYSGISETYATSYPETIKGALNRYRKIRLL